jgi:hypothetical protein
MFSVITKIYNKKTNGPNLMELFTATEYITKRPVYREGHAVAQWLRHCATNRKVAGSIPDSVIGNVFIDIILPAALWTWG